MNSILELALAAIAAPYVVGPIAVFHQQKFPERYRLNRLKEEIFLAEQTPTFLDLHSEITGKRFTSIGMFELCANNVRAWVCAYINKESNVFCTLSTLASQVGASTQVEFTEAYVDGSLINVSNYATLNVYPRNHINESYRFPEINNISALLNAAMKIFSLRRGDRVVLSLPAAEAWLILEAYLNAELDWLIAKGYVSGNSTTDGRRLTFKGALLMTWKMCWPIKQFLNWAQTSFAKRVLNSA